MIFSTLYYGTIIITSAVYVTAVRSIAKKLPTLERECVKFTGSFMSVMAFSLLI